MVHGNTKGSKRAPTRSPSLEQGSSEQIPKKPRMMSEPWDETLPSEDELTPSTVSDKPEASGNTGDNELDGKEPALIPGQIAPDAFQTYDWVTETKKERLRTFLNYEDAVNVRYAVCKVPPDAGWGTSGAAAKTWRHNGEAVTIWIPGICATKWFVDIKGVLPNRVNIGVMPLRDMDNEAALKLLRLCEPSQEPKAGPIYAGKLMSQWVKDDTKPAIMPFTEIYDAREKFRQKKLMRRLPQTTIGHGDIVLIECNLTRFKTAETKDKPEWTEWHTVFELISVCLLEEAPTGTPLPVVTAVKDATDISL
ncbi:hypothetical protein GSI_14045 [Ganoderma sinense ZZ0214-1]|uniref:Uncharacterized protein n=1 Tax=Ganoderma sinense ZZ0214-1 TaxID=1077348 RepID=A0A2G8RS10_9APHY|nr:hypothetical protein GSI_14045 [Ganoderma sinense ZZ0214-1]